VAVISIPALDIFINTPTYRSLCSGLHHCYNYNQIIHKQHIII